MSVVFAASEAVPFCKTGGLADVAGSLPKALAAAGEAVSLFVPLHRDARRRAGKCRVVARPKVPLGPHTVEADVRRAEAGGVTAYLVDFPPFFDRPGVYGEGGVDYPDNAERFAFFSRAVLEACLSLKLDPEVIHVHDWQTGLVPLYLKTAYRGVPGLARARTLFTIHNLAYQGLFPKEVLGAVGLPWTEFSPESLEFYGKVSYLKAGLAHADLLSTVSETYAREIQTPEFGAGLDGLLRRRAADLHGVRNGLDLGLWDPGSDEELPRTYGAADAAEGKAAAKAALQEGLGLERRPDTFLVGSVTRLDPQKGVDLALEAMEPLLARDAQYALLGSGDSKLEKAAADFAARHPGRAAFRRVFDDPLARRIYAGSDAFLMPSRFEPCGLGQLIAMRYGSVPVAVRTGGLADTVPPHGFLAPDTRGVAAALGEARAAFKDPRGWALRRRGAMEADSGWGPAAVRYRELYALLRSRVPGHR